MRGLISFLTFTTGITALCGMPDRAVAQGESGVMRNFPWEGEVTGTSVYIRSGAGGNYYPTTKVGPGTRLLVVGEKFGWYEIVPPIGSFSYIDQTLVEKSEDGSTGTVSQENVYVRAGSELERRKTSTQLLLAKGATVSIIGEADGFFKVVPPRGAHLFISAQYVAPVPERTRSGLLEKYMSEGGPVSSSVAPVVDSTVPVKKSTLTDGTIRSGRTAMPVAVKSSDESSRAINTNDVIIPPPQDRVASAQLPAEVSPVAVDVGRAPPSPVIDSVAANRPSRPSQPSRPVSENGTSAWIESQFASHDGSPPIQRPDYTNQGPVADSTVNSSQAPNAISTPAAPPSPFAASPPSNAIKVDGRNVTTIEVTSPTGSGRYDAQIQMLEAEMQSELRKPIMDQKLASIRDRFGPISIQNDDQVAKEIAKIRIRQLNDRIALQSSRMALAAEARELEAYRKRSDEERIAIAKRVASYSAPVSYDVTGELRKSAAFGPEKRRYRLVNPKSGTTIGYVDVPNEISTNVDQWIGQMVGVKASGKNYSNAARMTFYVAESITPLGGGSGSTDADETSSEPIIETGSSEGVIEFTEMTPVGTPVTRPRPTSVSPASPVTPMPSATPAPRPQTPSKPITAAPLSEVPMSTSPTPEAAPVKTSQAPAAKPVPALSTVAARPAAAQANAMPKPVAPAPAPVKPAPAVAIPVTAATPEPIESDDPEGRISFTSPTPTFSNDGAGANKPANLSGGSDKASSNPTGTGNTPADKENTPVEPLEPLD